MLAAFMVAGASVLLSGCSTYNCNIPRDPLAECYGKRCYIEDAQFVLADRLYSKLGSLTLVERHLRETEQWRSCEISEAMYRLHKVHNLP